MITTTTTPSAETPSAITPSAIPSANSKDEPCPVCTYNSIQWHISVLGQHLCSHQGHLDDNEDMWRESHEKNGQEVDKSYLDALYKSSYLNSEISLIILGRIKDHLKQLQVK